MVAPVINMPSKKHSGVSGMNTQLMVQHSGETPLRGGIAQSLTASNNADPNWEASWPSFVDPIARVRQIAWPNSAWTQGWANAFSVGLECAGYARFSKADWLTAEGLKQLENLAHEWVYYLKKEKAAGNTIPLRWLTTAEVQKVMAGNRSIKGFCTHAQIDPASRTDPGPNFPYDRLMNRIKQLMGVATTTTTTTKGITLSAAEVKEIKDYTADLLLNGYTLGGKKHKGILTQILEAIDDPNGDWDYKRRGETQDASGKVHETQMNTRQIKEAVVQMVAQNAAVLAAIEKSGQGGTPAEVQEAARAGAEVAIAQWEKASVESIAQAIVDEQAQRLSGTPAE